MARLIRLSVAYERKKRMQNGERDGVAAGQRSEIVVIEIDPEVSALIVATDDLLGAAAVPKQTHTRQTGVKPSRNGNGTIVSPQWLRTSYQMTVVACRLHHDASVKESVTGTETENANETVIRTGTWTVLALVATMSLTMIVSAVIEKRNVSDSIDVALTEVRMMSSPMGMIDPRAEDALKMRMTTLVVTLETRRYDYRAPTPPSKRFGRS